MISSSSKMHMGVEIGDGTEVGEFVIVGVPPAGMVPGELKTRIGERANIRSHCVIYAGNTIGDEFQTGHGVLIREGNEIGRKVSVGTHTIVEHHVKIGDHVRIHSNAYIPEYSTLESYCWIGPSVTLTNALYPLSSSAKENLIGPTIEEHAKIGGGAILLPGITVGKNALVGAGAVVVRDVPPNSVVVGNPARVVRDISEIREYQL